MHEAVSFYRKIIDTNLVLKIGVGIVLGVLLALLFPNLAKACAILGELFVGALKAVAPILVFVLVAASIANQTRGEQTNIKGVISLYLFGTFFAALTAVAMSFAFPSLLLLETGNSSITPPENVTQVLHNLLFNLVDNPINALMNGNYIGILVWAIGLGFALHHANKTTKVLFQDIADSVSSMVRFIIQLAPIGIFGLVANTVANTGFSALAVYAQLLFVLLASMALVMFVINPAIVYSKTKQNPYPLIFQCLRESGVNAFFTRSSAANIPVNMQLCEKLGLDKNTYSVSIPLGATINMAGAAITITVLTLAAANTLGIAVDFGSALLLSLIAALSACGASGIAGGSLLLVPLACNLFGIPNEIAMQVVGVGFTISVLQDSAETALNSSTDVIFTAAACSEYKIK